jgi:hypothetical protein
MTLHEASYDFRWVSVPGDPVFRDARSGVACH